MRRCDYTKHTGKTVLEVGVGIGVDAHSWSRDGNKVFGIDYNLPSVEITKARFKEAGANGTFLNSDAENLAVRRQLLRHRLFVRRSAPHSRHRKSHPRGLSLF